MQVSRTWACPPWLPFSLLPLASAISGCGHMSRGISCTEGLNRVLFLPSLLFRNGLDFAGDHKNSVLIPPPPPRHLGLYFILFPVGEFLIWKRYLHPRRQCARGQAYTFKHYPLARDCSDCDQTDWNLLEHNLGELCPLPSTDQSCICLTVCPCNSFACFHMCLALTRVTAPPPQTRITLSGLEMVNFLKSGDTQQVRRNLECSQVFPNQKATLTGTIKHHSVMMCWACVCRKGEGDRCSTAAYCLSDHIGRSGLRPSAYILRPFFQALQA